MLSKSRIKAAYAYADGNLYVSISGGVDSEVLLHLARSVFPDLLAVFVDTGLEYPENRAHVKTLPNVTWLRPNMTFQQVIQKYGFPVVSKEVAQKVSELKTTHSATLRNTLMFGDSKGNGKLSDCWKFLVDAPFKISHKCCDVLKKSPAKRFERETGRIPLIGIMAEDSRNRKTEYLVNGGCNMFKNVRPKSEPLAFWTKQDVWNYIRAYNLPYSKAYDLGYTLTGCMFCGFGVQRERSDLFTKNKFELMRSTHPKQYKYCMDVLGLGQVLDYLHVNR